MGAIYADKADLVFIDQYYAIIGKENYQYFVDLCCKAYNVIRKHANFFLILFSLVQYLFLFVYNELLTFSL
jgi:hypothetical protein